MNETEGAWLPAAGPASSDSCNSGAASSPAVAAQGGARLESPLHTHPGKERAGEGARAHRMLQLLGLGGGGNMVHFGGGEHRLCL